MAPPQPMKVQTSNIRKPAPSLLDLPAEVRNRIYGFTYESTNSDYTNYLKLYPSRNHNAASSKNPEPPRVRQFMGLMQTNRQLRYEFRPIYMSRIQVRLSLEDTSRYITAFFPESQAATNYLCALITVFVPENACADVDILPLMNLPHYAPRILIRILSGNILNYAKYGIPWTVKEAAVSRIVRRPKPSMHDIASVPISFPVSAAESKTRGKLTIRFKHHVGVECAGYDETSLQQLERLFEDRSRQRRHDAQRAQELADFVKTLGGIIALEDEVDWSAWTEVERSL
ncbi:hypothetical protein J1614_003271 [Plenodomus biglobosus]|nr:hypothetical protein J1614_003271 [Plenodomus biglobosus]